MLSKSKNDRDIAGVDAGWRGRKGPIRKLLLKRWFCVLLVRDLIFHKKLTL